MKPVIVNLYKGKPMILDHRLRISKSMIQLETFYRPLREGDKRKWRLDMFVHIKIENYIPAIIEALKQVAQEGGE